MATILMLLGERGRGGGLHSNTCCLWAGRLRTPVETTIKLPDREMSMKPLDREEKGTITDSLKLSLHPKISYNT